MKNLILYLTLLFTLFSNLFMFGVEPTKDKYVAKDFDYLIERVPAINEDLFKMHFKLYQGYVNNTNAILQKLQELTNKGESRTPQFGALKRILGWEFDGMLLHEYYFE